MEVDFLLERLRYRCRGVYINLANIDPLVVPDVHCAFHQLSDKILVNCDQLTNSTMRKKENIINNLDIIRNQVQPQNHHRLRQKDILETQPP